MSRRTILQTFRTGIFKKLRDISNSTSIKMEKIKLDDYSLVKEGEATILYPKADKVFYNPIQQFNRDLSATAIRAWSQLRMEERAARRQQQKAKNGAVNSKKRNAEGDVLVKEDDEVKNEEGKQEEEKKDNVVQPWIRILEALSASGLRAIRYAKEIPHVSHVVANDFSPSAVESIKQNILYNQVEDKVVGNEGDAIAYMASQASEFHVIDLDPYGTAGPFMDSALQAVKDDGLLLVTCTDLGVLAGNGYPEKCFAMYGGTNLWGDATHESALRLVLNMIATTAAKYKKYIEPQLSLSIDFYVRLFIKVRVSPIKVKELASNTMITYSCSGCNATHNQYLGRRVPNPKGNSVQNNFKFKISQGPPCGSHCDYCGSVHHLTGPMWGGELHNKKFIDKVLEIANDSNQLDPEVYRTIPRITGMLTLAKNEISTPFYFKPSTASSVLRLTSPPINQVIAALGNAGYEASLTHASASAIKTNAPWEFIWLVLKKWMEVEGISVSKKLTENCSGFKILHNDNIGKGLVKRGGAEENEEIKISFEENELSKRVKKLRNDKILRYQQNPEKNWGPKAKPESK